MSCVSLAEVLSGLPNVPMGNVEGLECSMLSGLALFAPAQPLAFRVICIIDVLISDRRCCGLSVTAVSSCSHHPVKWCNTYSIVASIAERTVSHPNAAIFRCQSAVL